MKNKSRFVNNNKNVVNVIIQNPQKKRHTYHKSKESNSESSSISSYSRPNISVPFTNTSNLENEILREQLNNIQSNRNPSMNRIGTIINDKFRNPLENADETFIKNGNNIEEVDVTSQSDLYSNKDFNMSDAIFDRLTVPYRSPASITSQSESIFTQPADDISEDSNFSTITEDAIQNPKPVKSKAVKPKAIKIQPIITNRPKPLSQMNKTQLKDEYRNLTGSSPPKMKKDQIIKAIKEYRYRTPK